jgi:hypothetical protein
MVGGQKFTVTRIFVPSSKPKQLACHITHHQLELSFSKSIWHGIVARTARLFEAKQVLSEAHFGTTIVYENLKAIDDSAASCCEFCRLLRQILIIFSTPHSFSVPTCSTAKRSKPSSGPTRQISRWLE